MTIEHDETVSSSTSEMADRLHSFAEFVERVRQDWQVQGLAIAIVKDGAVIYSQGFGKRDVAADLAVTPQTLFPIASCTKAFTTASMAILADDGKLDWDVPVRNYLPAFKLYDAFASERITPRDLVCHRSGLPRHDMAWYHSSASRSELVERLQFLEPTKDLRTLWQYQNLMYMTAGYLVEHIAGQSWEDFVQERIFKPLGMERSNFSILETIENLSDFSHPYQEKDEKVIEIPFYGAQGAVAPAGAIVSSVEEMSKWLLTHLNGGRYGDIQVISQQQIAQLHMPQMVIPETSAYGELPYASYAMGWFVTPYRGHSMVQHGGNIDGFSSLTSLFPQDNIGVVVLTNMEGTPVPRILTYNALEVLLGLDQVPWNERSQKEHAEFKSAAQHGKEKSATDRVPDTHPSHPLAAYVGVYAHPGYGEIEVALQDDQLQIALHDLQGSLVHYHYDTFESKIEHLDVDMKVSFFTNVQGDIASLSVPLEPSAKDIHFQRTADKTMRERSFLEPFVGVYELMGMSVTIALKDDHTLLATLPGTPEYVLDPYKGTEFHIKGMSGLSLEFQRDASGTVTEVQITQPGAVYSAKRKL